ncbi:MAG: hypothetical protein M3N41_03235 [Acidobacteriota bacterium]|nr:hypothetical protein [Acidobacteriota bacterium]
MTLSLALAWVITVGSLAGLLWWLTRLAQRRRYLTAPLDADVGANFSLDRYRPMAGLLAKDDLAFLEAQPGYRAEIGARWKRERRRLFRRYLHELKSDFRRLHEQAREMVAQSGVESAGFVEVLMKQHMTFLRATTALEFRLALQALGIGQVDVAPFLQRIEAMRADLAVRTASLAVA